MQRTAKPSPNQRKLQKFAKMSLESNSKAPAYKRRRRRTFLRMPIAVALVSRFAHPIFQQKIKFCSWLITFCFFIALSHNSFYISSSTTERSLDLHFLLLSWLPQIKIRPIGQHRWDQAYQHRPAYPLYLQHHGRIPSRSHRLHPRPRIRRTLRRWRPLQASFLGVDGT